MRIRKLVLENFKKFRKLELPFHPGINVVYGPRNEAGKSTLLEGIIAALFENPKSTRQGLELFSSWGSNHRCRTAVELEAGEKTYLLEKDFEAKTVRLSEVESGKEWDTPREVAVKVRELLGTDSSELYLATCCIRQDQLADVSSGKKEISESLEGVLTSGQDETVALHVIAELESQIALLTRGLDRPARSPGPLAQVAADMAKLAAEITIIQNEVAQTEQEKLELIEVSRQLSKVAAQLEDAGVLLEKNRKRRELEETLARLGKEYERAEAVLQDIARLQSELKQVEASLSGLGQSADELTLRQRRLGELDAARHVTENELSTARTERQEVSAGSRLVRVLGSPGCLIGGLVLPVVGIFGAMLDTAFLAVAVPGAALLIGSIWARAVLRGSRKRLASLDARINRFEASIRAAENEIQALLRQAGCASREELSAKKEKCRMLALRRSELQHEAQGRLGGRTLEAVEQERKEAVKALAVEKERLTPDLRDAQISPEEYVRLERTMERLRGEKDELARRRMSLEASIGRAKFDSEDLAEAEERRDALKKKLEHEKKRLRVYQLTRDFVRKAREETLVPATQYLQVEIGHVLEGLTGGRYHEARVSNDLSDLSVFSPEKGDNGDWVRLGDLSRGTRDEFYLACRLALVRLIFGEKAPPLVLDDPFINFDQERTERALKLLQRLGRSQQVILFSLKGESAGVADNVIELS